MKKYDIGMMEEKMETIHDNWVCTLRCYDPSIEMQESGRPYTGETVP